MRRCSHQLGALVPSGRDASNSGESWGRCAFSRRCSRRPSGSASDSEAEKAAKEIADARERANAAADAYFASESRIDQLDLEQDQLQTEITALEGDVKALQQSVESVAIGRYTRSGTTGVPLLTGFQSPEDQVKIDALLEVIYDSSANDFDRFDALNADLADKRAKLVDKKAQAEQERANLASLKDAASAEVQRLKDVEADRLKDEAVRTALIAENARRLREADRKKLLSAPSVTDAGTGGSHRPGCRSGEPRMTTVVMPVAIPAHRPVQPRGRRFRMPVVARPAAAETETSPAAATTTGTGLVGCARRAAAPAPFADTWGAPRSGGRRHQGVDMIGQRGIPVLAVVDGIAEPKSNVLGGTTIWFSGVDGNKYYYAHLDKYGQLGSVKAGTVIGFLGQTGNAQFSIPHLHFEVHPGGGPAVNPYPTVAAHCPSFAG